MTMTATSRAAQLRGPSVHGDAVHGKAASAMSYHARGLGCTLRRALRTTRNRRMVLPLSAARVEEVHLEQAEAESAPSLQELAKALELAVEREDYSAAAVLRDMLRAAENADPVISAQRALEACIREERYEDAARYRDLLAEIAPPPPAQLPPRSSAITRGVRVQVESFFVPAHSMPAQGQYFFAYKVTIINEGDITVQLRSRHWHIADANNEEEEVKGPGVVGEQPILNPGQSFSYTSACPLKTPYGTMKGVYEMSVLDELTGQWSEAFDAEVAEFGLTIERELQGGEQ